MGKLYLYLPERLLEQRNTDENVNIDCVILCATRASSVQQMFEAGTRLSNSGGMKG